MRHHLKGYLAGLSILVGENEKPEVLSCLHQCKESLQVRGFVYVIRNFFNIICIRTQWDNTEVKHLTCV